MKLNNTNNHVIFNGRHGRRVVVKLQTLKSNGCELKIMEFGKSTQYIDFGGIQDFDPYNLLVLSQYNRPWVVYLDNSQGFIALGKGTYIGERQNRTLPNQKLDAFDSINSFHKGGDKFLQQRAEGFKTNFDEVNGDFYLKETVILRETFNAVNARMTGLYDANPQKITQLVTGKTFTLEQVNNLKGRTNMNSKQHKQAA